MSHQRHWQPAAVGYISNMTNCQSSVIPQDSGTREGVFMTPSSYHAMMVNLKINAGIYPVEKVSCYCGSDNSTPMTSEDRYGMKYSLCLCKDCGILYANPRLTNASVKMFYENDYRILYSDRVEQSDDIGKDKIKNLIYQTLDDQGLSYPKTVFEIGCGTGTILASFSDYRTIGVDYDGDAIAKAKEKGLNVFQGGIEILEKSGEKADLIIMCHVLEHFTDLESELARIRVLLTDTGTLFITVPGLYVWDKASLMQSAHNYQFNGNTLAYVMNSCGFEEILLSEEIVSLWQKSGYNDKKLTKNPDEAKYIESYLTSQNFLMPNIRVSNKFPLIKRLAHTKYTIGSGIPQITELIDKHPDSEAIVVGGGPSVDNYVDKIKALKAAGGIVYAIERMYSWCLDSGITPDYVIALDASDDVIDSFKNISEDTTHLLFAQCMPAVIDKLKNHKSYYFLTAQRGIHYEELFRDKADPHVTIINTAGSLTLASVSIAMTLGAKRVHLFGFDCHVGNGNYASKITGVGCINDVMQIEVGKDGRVFDTTPSYFAFLQQFFQIYQIGLDNGLLEYIKIYGDSMVKHASTVDIDGDKCK